MIHTSTKINLKVDSRKHKDLFSLIKNKNSIDTDIQTFKFLCESHIKNKTEIKKLKTEILNLKLINTTF